MLEDGYEVVDLRAGIHWARIGAASVLEPLPAGELTDYQNALLESLKDIPRRIVEAERSYFESLLGPDILIQKRPYLRISRPGEKTDNIGFHRDTWYGDTPFELSVWIPLTDTDEGNALQVAPGSHVWPEEPTETLDPQAEKGSTKHALGFMYAPKKMRSVPMTPIPVKVGQMIVFPLSLLHGQEVNRSTKTRFSMDVRVTNPYFPINRQRSRGEHYETLSQSPVSLQANRYYEAQPS